MEPEAAEVHHSSGTEKPKEEELHQQYSDTFGFEVKTPSILDCPGCNQMCVGSRILTCCHLVCKKCLVSKLNSDENFTCPTCNITVPKGKQDDEQRLDQFPSDVVMDSLVAEILQQQSGGMCCVPHERESRKSAHVCFDCGDVFCDDCAHVHRNSSATRDHDLKSFKSLSRPKSSSADRVGGEDAAGEEGEANKSPENLKTEVELFQRALMAFDRTTQDLLEQQKKGQQLLKAYTDYASSTDASLTTVIMKRFGHVRNECLSAAEVGRPAGWAGEERERRRTRPLIFLLTCMTVALLSLLLVQVMGPEETCIRFHRSPQTSLGAKQGMALPHVPLKFAAGKAPASVPYKPDRVTVRRLDSPSTSLTGAPCGDEGCSIRYDDTIDCVLVTSDRLLLLTLFHQQSIAVHSSSGVQMIKLGCGPTGLTELPDRRLAVTCPWSSTILLVSLDAIKNNIQQISTKKQYWNVAANFANNTFIVSVWSDTIDVMSLKGEVIRTLVDSSRVTLSTIWSLTVVSGHLLVTDLRKAILLIQLSDRSPLHVETLTDSLIKKPRTTTADKAGNIFIGLDDGGVVIRTTGGRYRSLLREIRKHMSTAWPSVTTDCF